MQRGRVTACSILLHFLFLPCGIEDLLSESKLEVESHYQQNDLGNDDRQLRMSIAKEDSIFLRAIYQYLYELHREPVPQPDLCERNRPRRQTIPD